MKTKQTKRNSLKLLIPVMVLIIFGGCKKSMNSFKELENTKKEDSQLIILPNAKVKNLTLKQEAIILKEEDQKKVVFFKNNILKLTSGIEGLKVGSVLNSGPFAAAPVGFNLKVVSISNLNSVITLTCVAAALGDLIKTGEFEQGDSTYKPNLNGPSTETSWLGSGSGIVSWPVNLTAKLTYNSGQGVFQANVKGHSWVYMYYRRTGLFGDDDDYLQTGVGLAFSEDINNPDFVLKAGGKYELKTSRFNLPSFGFYVGVVWIAFGNTVGAGVKIEGTTELGTGIDLKGYGNVDCVKYAGSPVSLTYANNFSAAVQPPSFTNKSFNQSLSVAPYVDIQANLYNAGAFVFYGEAGLKTSLNFNPLNDITSSVDIKPYVKGGVKGKFFRWDYSFDQTFTFPLVYYRKFMVDVYSDPLGLSGQFRNKTFYGTKGYLSSENGWPHMKANRSSAGDWENFEIHYNTDGSYCFIANNGKLVNAAQDGLATDVYANLDWQSGSGTYLPSSCRFYISKQKSGKYVIQGKLRHPNSYWYDWGGKYAVQQYLQKNEWSIR